MVLQRIYRRWAAMRLQHLEDWTREWAHPAMFAGVKGGGADLAWWHTAAQREAAMLKDMCYRLGMADIWKCFDQVVPLLAHSILAIAGVPAPTLGAYSRMMNNVTVVNSLSIGIGEPYRRHCSIPQGCPWSMMILALLVRPWIHTIEACTAAVPRALADD